MAHWQQRVNNTFCDLEVSPREGRQFSASLNAIDRGELKIAFISADAQTVTRSRAAIRYAPADVFFLNLNIAGTSEVVDARGRSRIAAGEAVLMDAMQPYQLEYPGPFRAICVQFPQHWLRQTQNVSVDDAIGQGLRTATGAPRVLGAAIETLIEQSSGSSGHDVSIDLFLNVLAVSLRGIRVNAGVAKQGAAPRLGLLQHFLAESFQRPDLRPASAAKALGWSVRTVHKVCQDHGTTFSKMVLNARLSAVALQLSSRKTAVWRISDLAYDAGFTDLSYFCRVFKARYHMTPSRYSERFG